MKLNIKRNTNRNFDNKSKCLIICTSPLQMAIAEKIIDLNHEAIFDLIVITFYDNKKYRYYYHRLEKKCSKSLFYKARMGIKNYFNLQFTLYLNNFYKSYDKVYLASFDSPICRIILSKHKKANIYTFDDGLANIIPTSHYYIQRRLSIIEKFKKSVLWLIGVKLSAEQVKNLSIRHYTIFSGIPNIIRNTETISLYDEKNKIIKHSEKEKFTHEVNIFIGQPLHNFDPIFNSTYISNILESLNIDLYFPHPKEEESPKGNFKTIESELIFEDYLIKYLKDHPNLNLHIYSFFSSCLPNISQLNRVKGTYIHNEVLRKQLKDFYNFSFKALNIDNISID